MKLIFLGSGSAFTVGENNFHSNMLLEDDNQNTLLIDCGSDIRFSLHEQGLSQLDVKDVYISHLHADHAGGLEWLAFKSKFDSVPPYKPVLHISDQLIDLLWENVLSGGLQSIKNMTAELSTYFCVAPIGTKNKFTWNAIEFQLVQTEHVYNGPTCVPSFGLFFVANGKSIFITTDTQFNPVRYNKYYEKADVIFHDCETATHPSGVHTHYNQLVGLSPAIKAKMWLYHYNPGLLPDAVKDGFRGFVTKGQSFDLAACSKGTIKSI